MKTNRISLTLIGLTALTITACSPQETVPGGKKDAAPATTIAVDSGASTTEVALATEAALIADATVAIDTMAAVDSDLGPKLIAQCPCPTGGSGTQVCQMNVGCTECVCDSMDAGNTADTAPIATVDTAPITPDTAPVALDCGSDIVAPAPDTQGNTPDTLIPEVQAPPICASSREICGNLIDEDCDGLVDEADCFDPTSTVTATSTATSTGTNTSTSTTVTVTVTSTGTGTVTSCDEGVIGDWCSPFVGCYNGIQVCRSGKWICELDPYYAYGGCAQGTGGSTGTGGAATGTGGSTTGTGGSTAIGGTMGTGGSVGTGGNTGTGGSTDTGGTTGLGCNHVLVANQYMDIPDGQVITCADGNKAGQKKCVNGVLSQCVATSETTSGMKASVWCEQISSTTGKVTLTGNVIGDLNVPVNSLDNFVADTSAVIKICVNGDSLLGGMSPNQNYCIDYRPDSSFSYVYTDLPFSLGDNRTTFLGVTANGNFKWSNNYTINWLDPTVNRCRFSNEIVGTGTAKMVFKRI